MSMRRKPRTGLRSFRNRKLRQAFNWKMCRSVDLRICMRTVCFMRPEIIIIIAGFKKKQTNKYLKHPVSTDTDAEMKLLFSWRSRKSPRLHVPQLWVLPGNTALFFITRKYFKTAVYHLDYSLKGHSADVTDKVQLLYNEEYYFKQTCETSLRLCKG